ncbi:MAG: CheR family methyltransferase [Planctomycetota bacterium]|jgi:chemotaxis protein methyltransferase CheR
MNRNPTMTLEEFHLLNEILERRFGIRFSESNRDILAHRLARRLDTLFLGSFMEYYTLLATSPNGEASELAQAVTNNETYFFRERSQFDALVEDGIERLRPNLALPSALRILCAGCSSGEEAYTLAFYFADHTPNLHGLRPTIDAFDIDEARVAMARRRRYRSRSVREMTRAQIAKYLIEEDGGFEVKPQYHDVSFNVGNMIEAPTFVRPIRYDAVFCRNVMIYFSEAARRRTILNFARALRPGGLLFLGHSESIIGQFVEFEAVRVGGCILYQRTDA